MCCALLGGDLGAAHPPWGAEQAWTMWAASLLLGSSWGTDRMVTVEGARGEEVGGREWEGAGRRPQDAEGTRAGGPGEPPARGSPRRGAERAAAGRWERGRGGTARRRGATQEPAGCRWVPPPGSALPARGGGGGGRSPSSSSPSSPPPPRLTEPAPSRPTVKAVFVCWFFRAADVLGG